MLCLAIHVDDEPFGITGFTSTASPLCVLLRRDVPIIFMKSFYQLVFSPDNCFCFNFCPELLKPHKVCLPDNSRAEGPKRSVQPPRHAGPGMAQRRVRAPGPAGKAKDSAPRTFKEAILNNNGDYVSTISTTKLTPGLECFVANHRRSSIRLGRAIFVHRS